MPTLKPRLTMNQKVDNLLRQAEEIYLNHFGVSRTSDIVGPSRKELNAAVFGYIYGMSFTDNAEFRDICYAALQKRFDWDDEYIAINVIGG